MESHSVDFKIKPKHSIYGMFTYIWLLFMVFNVSKYTSQIQHLGVCLLVQMHGAFAPRKSALWALSGPAEYLSAQRETAGKQQLEVKNPQCRGFFTPKHEGNLGYVGG